MTRRQRSSRDVPMFIEILGILTKEVDEVNCHIVLIVELFSRRWLEGEWNK